MGIEWLEDQLVARGSQLPLNHLGSHLPLNEVGSGANVTPAFVWQAQKIQSLKRIFST